MPQMIFVNLPVEDLPRSVAFYNGLGWPTDARFADDQASNAVVSEAIVVMLLTKPFFAGFTPRPIADTRTGVAVLNCLSRESRAEVDALVDRALALGATEERAAQDMGFKYSRAFTDPDGHVWEVMWMDVTQMPAEA